jgi:hypothetical protein
MLRTTVIGFSKIGGTVINVLTRAALSAIAMLAAGPADPLLPAQRGDTLHCRPSGAVIRMDAGSVLGRE